MHTNAPATVVAYHRLRLREIRERYEELRPTASTTTSASRGTFRKKSTPWKWSSARSGETLISLGVDLDGEGTIHAPDHPVTPLPPKSRASKPHPQSISMTS